MQLWHEVPWYRVSSAAAAAGGEGGSSASSASLPSSPLVQLHNEVLDFCDLLAPTKTEVAERHKIINTVKDTVGGWCGQPGGVRLMRSSCRRRQEGGD